MPVLFIVVFIVLLACTGIALWLGSGLLESSTKSELMGRLKTQASSSAAPSSPVFLEERREARPLPMRTLESLIKELDTRALAAGTDWSGSGLLAASGGLAALGAVLGWNFPVLILPWFTCVVLSVLLGSIPLLVVSSKRSKRLGQFEEQFPESLDFIARALRAGHAFSVSLEMLAAESPSPSGEEWRRVFREHSLGAPLESALLGMAERIPLIDVKFFVSAVALQREAGGNLSEILTNLAGTVRERFRLKGHIRAATAHARITSVMLSVIPLVTLVGLQIRSPIYMRVLLSDTQGQLMLLAALVLQILGYLLMRRIIDIRV